MEGLSESSMKYYGLKTAVHDDSGVAPFTKPVNMNNERKSALQLLCFYQVVYL
jgi:hypothetical protein